jgi:hypothetical protein
MAKDDHYGSQLQQFRVAVNLTCPKKRPCGATHFLCPYCGSEEGSAGNDESRIFSVTCEETGGLFLVDQQKARVPRKAIQ